MTRQVDALTPILRSFSVQNSKHGSANARTRNYTTTAYNIDLISFQEKKRSYVFSKPLLDSYLDIRMCSSKPQCSPNISEHMYNVSGVVRPLYHKAPVNTSYVEPPSYPPVNKPTGIPQNAAVLPPNIEHPDRNELDARLEALLLRYKHELKSASKIP